MENLAKQPILSYTKYDEPLSEEKVAEYLTQLTDWRLIYQEGNPRIERNYQFDDFLGAIDFANQVAELSEEAHHHPDLVISWGKCTVRWWTFVYKRLHENDFIMAARTELLYKELS
jgi:4a-hydroxytetrahydrobiopterin dehydratase